MHEMAHARATGPTFTGLIQAALAHALVVCSALILGACSTPRSAPSAASSTPLPSASAAPPSAPPLDLTSAVAWPHEYEDDTLWTRALRGDALDRHALAQREGARGLVTALVLGGELGRTALAALPFAPDARDASAELCRLLSNAGAPTREWLLSTLHALLLPDDVIAFEPHAEANGDCREQLVELDSSGALSASEHDLVASALVYLEPAAAR